MFVELKYIENLDKDFVLFSFRSFWWLKRCRDGGWSRVKGTLVEKGTETMHLERTAIDS